MFKHFIQVIAIVTAFAGFTAALAMEQSARDKPLARTANDASLKWGPCPEFFPAGCQIAVLHGDPARENADVFFKVPANYEIPNHWHTSAERMVLVSGEMTVNYENHEPVTLKPGSYAYGPPKVPHTGTCEKGDECVLFIAFEEPVDAHLVE